MKETRRRSITNKVVSHADLVTLSNSISAEFEISQLSMARNTTFTIRIKCHDDTTYESNTLEIIQEILGFKRLESVVIDYVDYDAHKHINLDIDRRRSGSIELIISGTDKNWVRGTFTHLTEQIDGITSQTHFLLKYRRIMFHVYALCIGIIINFVFSSVFDLMNIVQLFGNKPKRIVLAFWQFQFVMYFLNWLAGMPIAFSVQEFVIKGFFPPIEFDFGPDHYKFEKNRRMALFVVCVGVVLPFSLSIIFEIIKPLFFK